MGYDPIVGISIIMLGGAVGFSTGAMNLATTGTAQGIAELPVFSGMGYRLFCIIPFLIVTVIYVIRYGRKIKADPTKSYTYNVPLDLAGFNPDETLSLIHIYRLQQQLSELCIQFFTLHSSCVMTFASFGL